MKKIAYVAGLLLIYLVMVNFWGCTNSEPIRPEEYSTIYCSPDSLTFTFPTQIVEFSMRYIGGYGTLAWYITSQPNWVILQPASGYLTTADQYINASINQEKLYSMPYGTYSGTVVIYSSEGTKNIKVVFIYKI